MSDQVNQTKSNTRLGRQQLEAPRRKGRICVDLHFSTGCVAGLLRFYGLIRGSALMPAPTAQPRARDPALNHLGDLFSPQCRGAHRHRPPAWRWRGGGYREKAGVTQIHGATAEGLGWITAKVGRVLGQGWLHRHVTWAVTQGPGLRKAHVQFNALSMS